MVKFTGKIDGDPLARWSIKRGIFENKLTWLRSFWLIGSPTKVPCVYADEEFFSLQEIIEIFYK
jgi:hypothetical protein